MGFIGIWEWAGCGDMERVMGYGYGDMGNGKENMGEGYGDIRKVMGM